MVYKPKVKSSLKSQFAHGLTCFDPKVIFMQSDLGLKRVDIVIEELHGAKRISESMAERAKKQYTNLTTKLIVMGGKSHSLISCTVMMML